MVKTRFFVDNRCVWEKESPVDLTIKEIDKTIGMLKEKDYGVVNCIEIIKGT